MFIKIEGQPEIEVDLEHFARRVIEDALTQASAAYWERRAETFDWVGPHCAEVAKACRNHAEAIRRGWIEVVL